MDTASAVSDSVRVVIERMWHSTRARSFSPIAYGALPGHDQLFNRAGAISESAVDEMCDWAAVEGDWMMAFSYCKSLSRLSLTRTEMSRLTNRGRRSSEIR